MQNLLILLYTLITLLITSQRYYTVDVKDTIKEYKINADFNYINGQCYRVHVLFNKTDCITGILNCDNTAIKNETTLLMNYASFVVPEWTNNIKQEYIKTVRRYLYMSTGLFSRNQNNKELCHHEYTNYEVVLTLLNIILLLILVSIVILKYFPKSLRNFYLLKL